MFKQITQGLGKFFTKERIFILVIFLVLSWGILTYSGSKSFNLDGMTTSIPENSAPINIQSTPTPSPTAPITPTDNYALQPVANPTDLLPKDQNSHWSALNPNTMTQGNILMPDLLQAGYHIGLDTIGQTLRNANLQERSDPVIPKSVIGPWNQSTIEPDLGRVPLELGMGVR